MNAPTPAQAVWDGPTLREVIRDLQLLRRSARRSQSGTHPTRANLLEQNVEALRVRFTGIAPRQVRPEDLRETVAAIRTEWRLRASLEQLHPAHVRRFPWVVFLPELRDLREESGFLAEFGNLASRRFRGGHVAHFLFAWLRYFPEDSTGRWREAVAREVARGDLNHHRRVQRANEVAEATGARRIDGPHWLAEHLLHSTEPGRVLSDSGLTGELGRGGYAAAVLRELLRGLESRLVAARVTTEQLWALISEVVFDVNEPRFPDQRTELANALLRPYTGRDPGGKLQELIRSCLLGQLGDPRTRPHSWGSVAPEARNVMYRWLTRETLETFFDVIDATAVDVHWKYRRAFWLAYLNGGHLSDAWVAFGPEARAQARRGEGLTAGSFGQLSGGLANHSVLIMRLARLTIAEWSHSGCCWVWGPGASSPPRLYDRHYEASDLRGSRWDRVGADEPIRSGSRPLGFVHWNSPGMLWQRRVRDAIHHLTNVVVETVAFLPDGRG